MEKSTESNEFNFTQSSRNVVIVAAPNARKLTLEIFILRIIVHT